MDDIDYNIVKHFSRQNKLKLFDDSALDGGLKHIMNVKKNKVC